MLQSGPGTVARVTLADRLKALRKAMQLTQEQLAERSGLRRTELPRLEGGSNKGSSLAIRQALADGFGLTLDQINAYLDGLASLQETVDLIKQGGASPGSPMSPFEIAVAYLGDAVSPEAVARVRAWARAQPTALPPRAYGDKLIEVQRELLERLSQLPPATPTGTHVRKKRSS
ncbi:helix-turn-helix domain-containing protein [Sorangium sp. So ce119]|uniref:helix-turn-helix domain-containing protein n=1 Tax=Sorangium sp. So ce119 TaxID=3133279 RepID=UPI003F5EB74D